MHARSLRARATSLFAYVERLTGGSGMCNEAEVACPLLYVCRFVRVYRAYTGAIRHPFMLVHVRVAFRVLEREPCHSVCLYKTLEQRPRARLLVLLLTVEPRSILLLMHMPCIVHACWYGLGGTF